MSASPRTIVVFGTGPQLGTSIAGRFASEGFDHLVLLSRNASRLEEDKKAVIAAAARGNIRVDTVTVDLSSEESVQKALQQVDGLVGAVEVVLYNGARVAPTPLFETPAEDIVNDFKVSLC
jgi:NAD(P)-dependent dehydrogenase (short-subunit alcohol dehydrogenase family)